MELSVTNSIYCEQYSGTAVVMLYKSRKKKSTNTIWLSAYALYRKKKKIHDQVLVSKWPDEGFDQTKINSNSFCRICTIILHGLPENSKEDNLRKKDYGTKVTQLRRIKSALTFCTEL